MKKLTINEFGGGLSKDFHSLTTPSNILTSCVNGTTITFDGNEFMIQNDNGNIKFGDNVRLQEGYVPVGMKEFGGVIYVASYNPETGAGEVGSFPSPETLIDSTETGVFNQLQDEDFNITNDVVSSSIRANLVDELLDGLRVGDRYAIYYMDNIDERGALLDQIEADGVRKNYRVRYFFISENGSLNLINDLALIDANDVFTPESVDTQDPRVIDGFDDFTVYKEREKVKIAVQVIFESLDFFRLTYNVNVNTLEASKTVDLRAFFSHSSNVKARGFEFNFSKFPDNGQTSTETGTKYFNFENESETQGASSALTARLAGLVARDRIDYTAIPYSQYEKYPELEQSGSILTEDSAELEGLFDIYRYFINQDSMNLEFRYGFNGEANKGFKNLYVEFFDIWSGHSMIREIGPYSSNNEILEMFNIPLIDEPVSTTFNGTTRGGTPATKLSTEKPPGLLDSSVAKLPVSTRYRTDGSLRKNHFYIVRISGVEVVDGADKFHDVVYGLYTIPYFNQRYLDEGIEQTPSFANLPIDTSAFGYTLSANELSSSNDNSNSKIDNYDGSGESYNTNDNIYNINSALNGDTIYNNDQVLGTTLETNIYSKLKEVSVNREFSSESTYGVFNEDTIELSPLSFSSTIDESISTVGTYRDAEYLAENNLGTSASSATMLGDSSVIDTFNSKIDNLSYEFRTERAIQGKIISNNKVIQKQIEDALVYAILDNTATNPDGTNIPGFFDDEDWVREWIRGQCSEPWTIPFVMPHAFVAYDRVKDPDRYRLYFRHGDGDPDGYGFSNKRYTDIDSAVSDASSFSIRQSVNDSISVISVQNDNAGYTAHGTFDTNIDAKISTTQTKVAGPAFRTCEGSSNLVQFTKTVTDNVIARLSNDVSVNIVNNDIGVELHPTINAGSKTLSASITDTFTGLNTNELVSRFRSSFELANGDPESSSDINILTGLYSTDPDLESWTEYFTLSSFGVNSLGSTACYGDLTYTNFPKYTGATDSNSLSGSQFTDTLLDLI